MRREFYNLNDTLKISHLVVNGCSFTYGSGIANPVKDSWSSLVAKKLGVPLVNLSFPGMGNDRMHRQTFNYFYKDLYNDNHPLYIHAYTQSFRREIYESKNSDSSLIQAYKLVADISANASDLEKEIILNTDDYQLCLLELQKLQYWASINALLDTYKVDHLTTDYMPQTDGEIYDWVNKNCYELKTEIETHPAKLRNFDEITESISKTRCQHETEEGHALLADYIYNQIVKRYKDIQVLKENYSKLSDILIESPNVKHLKKVGVDPDHNLLDVTWKNNVYYLNEIGLDYKTINWIGKP